MRCRATRSSVVGTYMPDMALADVHVHTRFSDGWFTVEVLAETALAAGLHAIVVTDHDEVAGGLNCAITAVVGSCP